MIGATIALIWVIANDVSGVGAADDALIPGLLSIIFA